MRKCAQIVLSLLMSVLFCLGLISCASTDENASTVTTKPSETAKWVREWKANVLESFMDGVKTDKVAVIELNADGTATYKGKSATWEYKDDTIHLAVTGAGVGVLEIAEDNGKTVLKLYEDTYYRAEEFEE